MNQRSYPCHDPIAPARRPSGALMGVMVCVMSVAAWAGPMDQNKPYDVPVREQTIPQRLLGVLSEALKQPDTLTRLQALEAIAQHKLTDLAEPTIAALDDQVELVRLSAIRALDAMDHRPAADKLASFASIGKAANARQREMVLLVDRLLARWQRERTVGTWINRLRQAEAGLTLQISAAQALQQIKATDADSLAILQSIATDTARPVPLRMAAAEALGQLRDAGLNAPAAQLVPEGLVGRVMAARLLQRHHDSTALELLMRLAQDEEPAVAHLAMRAVFAADAKRLWPLVDQALASADPKVRRVAVESLAQRTQPISVTTLMPVLDDPHPQVRTTARQVLLVLAAEPALDRMIRTEALSIIDVMDVWDAEQQAQGWRAVEQAAILLGERDHKPAADALVRLFTFNRTEVEVASVIALRGLAVPATRTPMFQFMTDLIDESERNSNLIESGDATRDMLDRVWAINEVAAEVAQTLGVWRVAEADKPWRRLIPKMHPIGTDARASAIWALGWLHEDQEDRGLAGQLIARANDVSSMIPEAEEVRLASVRTLGRMRAASQKGRLLEFYRMEGEGLELRSAAGWAVERITGEALEPMVVRPREVRGTFIEPTGD